MNLSTETARLLPRVAHMRRVAEGADGKAALEGAIDAATAEIEQKQQRLDDITQQLDAMTSAADLLRPLAGADMDPVMRPLDALAAAMTQANDTIAGLATAIEQLMQQIETDTKELEAWDATA